MCERCVFQKAFDECEDFRNIILETVKDLDDYKENAELFGQIRDYRWSLVFIDYPELYYKVIDRAAKIWGEGVNVDSGNCYIPLVESFFEDVSEDITTRLGLGNYGVDHVVSVLINDRAISLTLNNGLRLEVYSLDPTTIHIAGTTFEAELCEGDRDTETSLFMAELMRDIEGKMEIEISLSKSDLFSNTVDIHLNYIIKRFSIINR